MPRLRNIQLWHLAYGVASPFAPVSGSAGRWSVSGWGLNRGVCTVDNGATGSEAGALLALHASSNAKLNYRL